MNRDDGHLGIRASRYQCVRYAGYKCVGYQGTRVPGIRVPVYMCQVSGYQGEVSGYSGVRYQHTRVPGCQVSGYRGIVLFILGSFSLVIVHSAKSLK